MIDFRLWFCAIFFTNCCFLECPDFWVHHTSLCKHPQRSGAFSKSKNLYKNRDPKSAAFLFNFERIFAQTSEDVHRGCHDVLGGQSNIKTPKFIQKLSETAIENWQRFFSILNTFSRFEVALTSEDDHRGCNVVCRGCHDIHGGLSNLKRQKFAQNRSVACYCLKMVPEI